MAKEKCKQYEKKIRKYAGKHTQEECLERVVKWWVNHKVSDSEETFLLSVVGEIFGEDENRRQLTVRTPAGVIRAEEIPDDDYPGIALVFEGYRSGAPGVIMEYTASDNDPLLSRGNIVTRVYTMEKPDDDPSYVLRMTSVRAKDRRYLRRHGVDEKILLDIACDSNRERVSGESTIEDDIMEEFRRFRKKVKNVAKGDFGLVRTDALLEQMRAEHKISEDAGKFLRKYADIVFLKNSPQNTAR